MKFRALNFDYQLEASAYVESIRRSREVIFIRQATQNVGTENFEPTSKKLNQIESEKLNYQETSDSRAELPFPAPLTNLCETSKNWMSKLQLKAFLNEIINIAKTKRISSCPWNDIEPQQQAAVPRGIGNFDTRNDALSSTERKEADHNSMEEDFTGLYIPQTPSPEDTCFALVPYMRHSDHAHGDPTFQPAQVALFSRQEMEVLLFAIQVAVTANSQNAFNRKRLFDDNQNEGDLHRPSRKIPKQQRDSDSLFETSRNKLVSFQGIEEHLETSRPNETEAVLESCQERPVFDEAIGDIPLHGFNNIDVESKAQRKKRKEEKRKRRDQKLAKSREKKQQRMGRDASNQEQSKRAREDPTCEESRDKISLLATECCEISCYDLASEGRDLLPDDIGGKRRKTEAPTGSLNGLQPGENIKQSQYLAEKRSDVHTSVEQRPRLPVGTKVSSLFSFFGREGDALKKQKKAE